MPLMNKFKNMKIGKTQWIVIILIGVLLLVIAIPTDSPNLTISQGQKEKNEKEEDSEDYSKTYERTMEERLKEILEQMDGVGQVDVMITLKDQGESVIAKDTQTQSSTQTDGSEQSSTTSAQQSSIYDGDDTPYESKEVNPKVEGVLVVAQGAGNATIRKNIYDAVLALFPVEPHKIKIVKMGSQEE